MESASQSLPVYPCRRLQNKRPLRKHVLRLSNPLPPRSQDQCTWYMYLSDGCLFREHLHCARARITSGYYAKLYDWEEYQYVQWSLFKPFATMYAYMRGRLRQTAGPRVRPPLFVLYLSSPWLCGDWTKSGNASTRGVVRVAAAPPTPRAFFSLTWCCGGSTGAAVAGLQRRTLPSCR